MADFANFSEEEILTEEECAELDREARPKRIILSAIHLIITAVAFIGCLIWQKDILSAIIFYSLGYVIIHLVVKRIPNIGFYKPGYYEVWQGNDCTRVRDDSYVEFYGFGSIGFEVLIEMIGYGVVAALLWAFLPNVMSYAVIFGAICVMTFKCILFPLISDIVNIVSVKSRNLTLELFNKAVTFLGIGLVVLFLVGSCIAFPFISPKMLDVNKAVETYYDENTYEVNALGEADLNGGEKKFKFFGTKCTVKQEGEFDLKNGMVKQGVAKIELEYMLTHWEVKRVTSTFEATKVVSPVSFTMEEVVSLADYEEQSIVCLTVDEFYGTEGKGSLTVTSKETGKIAYTSTFKLVPKYDVSISEYTMDVVLDDPIQFGYFGFGKLELKWDMAKDKMELETFGEELKYTDNK